MQNTLTNNITFTKMEITDIPFFIDIRNGYAKEYLHNSTIFTLENAYEWFNKTNPDYWIIKNNEVPIGYFRLSNYNKQNRNILIGADIHSLYAGKGYGYESYKKFIPFIFKEYDLHKISLEVLATNERAIHLYKKIGFNIEGIKREDVLKEDKWVDSIIMSIFKEN